MDRIAQRRPFGCVVWDGLFFSLTGMEFRGVWVLWMDAWMHLFTVLWINAWIHGCTLLRFHSFLVFKVKQCVLNTAWRMRKSEGLRWPKLESGLSVHTQL